MEQAPRRSIGSPRAAPPRPSRAGRQRPAAVVLSSPRARADLYIRAQIASCFSYCFHSSRAGLHPHKAPHAIAGGCYHGDRVGCEELHLAVGL